jgi:glycosyltransferase involved in cell wall biosynthesis
MLPDTTERSRSELERSTLRVLLVPDSIHWITGTLARSFIAHNQWLEGTIISGPVLDVIAREQPNLFDSFDLVHFICPYASRAWLPRLKDRLPCVTSHHHVSDRWELQSHNLDGDAIVVGSTQWAEDVVQRGATRDKVVCNPYGVDAARFVLPTEAERASARESLGISSKAMVVGFFAKRSSNEGDRKGTDVFAAAVRALSKQAPSLAVLIIGPGWDELVAELTAAGVACVWRPFIRDARLMPSMYQALDFYWVTARVEGGPVTLLEAMSSGVCCLTTPVGLAREIVDDGVNGVVVSFDNVNGFVHQTLAYAIQPATRARLGANARATILQSMDLPVTARGIRRAYDIALERFALRRVREGASLPPSASDSALPNSVRCRIAILEQLAWAEALILQKQRLLAIRIMMETWLAHPASSLAPRYLLRNFLPKSIVRSLVRVRGRASVTAE